MGNSEWIPASIKPEQTAKGTFCLIERNGKLYPEKCYYFNKHQQDFCPDGNEDWADFENDEYYLPEGWYTLCDQCEKYWKVDVSFYMIGLDYPVINSHSPNTEQTAIIYQEYKNGDFVNTLQEGDYVTELTLEQWFDIIDIMDSPVYPIWEYSMRSGLLFNGKTLIHYDPKEIKTKLAPEEFLRRAENTFKTK